MSTHAAYTGRVRSVMIPALSSVLIKTLLKAGIITERTRPVYAAWVDMDELSRESDEVAGQAVADAAMIELRDINQGRKKIGRAQRATAR